MPLGPQNQGQPTSILRITHGESQKFASSTCGIEMLACGGYSFSNRALPPNDHALGKGSVLLLYRRIFLS